MAPWWDPVFQVNVDTEDEEENEEEEEEQVVTPVSTSFQNSEAFLAALELYNRDGCTIQESLLRTGQQSNDSNTSKKQRVLKQFMPTRMWKARPVAGSHRKGCDGCHEAFFSSPSSAPPSYYFTDEWASFTRDFSCSKLCLSCMDQILETEYETTDLSTIEEKLVAKRQEQSGDDCAMAAAVAAAFPIRHYQKEYPNYPSFFRHFTNNDKHKEDKAQADLARRVADAWSRIDAANQGDAAAGDA